MPLVRYEIRNEHSLAKPELYRSAAKDEPETLLEGVAMAGLVGIVRQLGDLAEFAAEIFHDLHEVVMATAARGHELMIRVQQLEAEIPSIEKALMSETNQLRFAYMIGADWHASIRNDQNHLTQGDLPRFIRNSYEECRGPPRLFLLDRFDVAGSGACLMRYTDPSFFKMKWANSELRRAEKAQRERSIVRVKKKVRRRRNGEIAEVAGAQLNSRVHYSSVDLNGSMGAPRNILNTSNRRLMSNWVNGFQLGQVIGKNSMQGSSNLSAFEENHHDHILSQQWKRKPMAGMAHKAQMMDNLATDPIPKLQSLKMKAMDIEADRMQLNIMHGGPKAVLINGEIKPEVPADMDQMDDVDSETDNFVDALTTMDSEIETDCEYRIKHETDSDFKSDHRETRFKTSEDLRAENVECCVFVDVEASASFHNTESSDDSSKVGTCTGVYDAEPANASANAQSALSIMNTSSEDDFENVDPAASLPLVDASAECSAELDNGNISATVANTLSSKSVNRVQACNTANEEALSDHVFARSVATAADSVSAASDNHVQSPDAVLNRSFSFAFTSFEPSAIHAFAESRNNESADDLHNGNLSATVANTILSRSVGTLQMPDASNELALQDHFYVTPDATTADFLSIASTNDVETSDAVLNRSSSFAFANFVPSDVSLNATPSACFDNAEAFFRFTTPELSITYNDVKSASATPNEEPSAIAKSSAGVTDVELEICSSNIEKPRDCSLPLISTDFNIIESVAASELPPGLHGAAIQAKHTCTDELDSHVPLVSADLSSVGLASASSELASGLLDVVLRDEHACIELQVDYAENEIPAECVCSEKSCSRLESSTGFSLTTSAGCIWAQSEGEIINSDASAECVHDRPSTLLCIDTPSGGAHADMLGSDLYAESIGNRVYAVSPIKGAPQMESVTMEEEPADPTYTISRFPTMPMEFPPAMENAQMLENVPLPSRSLSRESSGDMSGDKLIANFETLKLDVNALKEDLNDGIPREEIQIDLAQVELAYVGGTESLMGSASSTKISKDLQPNEFTEAEVFLSAKDPNACLNTMAPDAFIHSSSPTVSTNAGLHDFVDIEPYGGPSAEMHAEICNAKPPTKFVDDEVPNDSNCNGLTTKYFSVELPTKIAVEPCNTFAMDGSSTSISYMEVHAHELSSHSSEHILSFHPAAQSPLSTYSANTEYVPETPTPEGNFSDFSRECSNQSLIFTTEPTVFSGIIMNTDGAIDSPRVAIASGTSSANLSSPSTSRESILPNVEYMDVKVGSRSPHTINSPRSSIPNALHSSLSPLRTSGDTQTFSNCQSIDSGFEIFVPSSAAIEPKFQGSNSSETPPPPPLPPLKWQKTRSHQSSCPEDTKLIEFPSPPPPPVKPDSLAQSTFSPPLVPGMEKSCIERNDSLIKAIASHDKSTLRKVIRQTPSLKPKPLDDREELLKQIRNRSFNLRHTVVKKHEIPQPTTNSNVAAILEKATAIRQAFVGSEDDEDDDWNDP